VGNCTGQDAIEGPISEKL